MKYLNILILSLCFTFFLGCKKGKVVSTNEPMSQNIQDLLNETDEIYSGQISFTEGRSLATQESLASPIQFSATFFDANTGTTQITNTDIKINNISIPNTSGWYQTIFTPSQSQVLTGSILEIKGIHSEAGFYTNFTFNQYYPSAIHLNYPNYVGMGADSTGMLQGSTIQANEPISWNADTSNTLGVAIFISYDPNRIGNYLIKSAGFNMPQTNYVVVDDNGVYNLNSELLEDIPDDAIIEVRVLRGNAVTFPTPNNTSKKIRITMLTEEFALFKYENN